MEHAPLSVSKELHMADDRTRDEQEAPSSAESEKGAETTPSPTAEQKEIDEVVADELRDDRFQASDN
ncbi:MAG: hypothetical protein AUH43_20550 [Acidobacteria bacterium 13_1_40CM_65_14]|nr:MAG: hypothetical protein AUH43_20550 [Acidobacteria bacterium 13_1_40CM_65_14]